MNSTVIYLRWPICTWKLFALDARSGVVVWSTALQVVGLRFRSRWGYFHWHKVSGRTMALGSTQLLTQMNIRGISRGVGLRSLPFSCADFQEILGCSTSWSLKLFTTSKFLSAFFRYFSPYLRANDCTVFYAMIASIQMICNLSFIIASLYNRRQPVHLEDKKAK